MTLLGRASVLCVLKNVDQNCGRCCACEYGRAVFCLRFDYRYSIQRVISLWWFFVPTECGCVIIRRYKWAIIQIIQIEVCVVVRNPTLFRWSVLYGGEQQTSLLLAYNACIIRTNCNHINTTENTLARNKYIQPEDGRQLTSMHRRANNLQVIVQPGIPPTKFNLTTYIYFCRHIGDHHIDQLTSTAI
jgi:hypothetical protein